MLALLEVVHSLVDDPDLAAEAAGLARAEMRRRFGEGGGAIRSTKTNAGLRIDLDVSDSFAASIFSGWLNEAEEFETFMNLVEPGDVVIDVGANFGLYALHAARYVGPHGAVVAFEPAPNVLALLNANVAANDLGGVIKTRCAAVSSHRGEGHLHVAQEVSFSGLRDTGRSPTAQVLNVDLTTLDSDSMLKGRKAALLKIDVEGGEPHVLQGALKLIARSPRLIVQFEYSYKNSTPERDAALADVLAKLTELGFGLFRIGAGGLEKLRETPSMAGRYSGNLYLARTGACAQRLAAAVRLSKREAPLPGVVFLMRHIAAQRDALGMADEVGRALNEVADYTLGPLAEPSDAIARLRAVEKALLAAQRKVASNETAAKAAAESHAQQLAVQRARVRVVTAERDHAQAKLAKKRVAITKLQAEVQRLGEERDALLAEAGVLRKESARARELEVSLAAMQAQRDEARERVQTFRNVVADLQTQIAAQQQDHDALTARTAALRVMRDRLQADIVGAQQAEAAARELAETASDKYGAEAERLRAANDRQADAMRKLNAKLDSYRASAEKLEARIGILVQERDTVVKKLDVLRTARDALHAKIDESRQTVETLEAHMATLQQDVTRVHALLAAAEARRAEHAEAFEKSQTKLAAFRAGHQSLTERVEVLEAERDGLFTQVQELQGSRNALESQMTALRTDASADVAQFGERLARLERERASLQAEQLELQARYEGEAGAARIASDQAKSEADAARLSLTRRIADIEAEVAALRADLLRERDRSKAQADLLDEIYGRFALVRGVLPPRKPGEAKEGPVA